MSQRNHHADPQPLRPQCAQVQGQTQDLVDLQRILLRGPKMSDAAQQNMTRWAVYNAALLLKQYGPEYEALQEAMGRGASIAECVKAIEGVRPAAEATA